MGCISAKVERIGFSPKVQVTKEEGCKVEVSKISSAIKAFVTYIGSLLVSVSCEKTPMNVEVSYNKGVNVNVGLVCSTTISDEIEMWWCDGWKALWNNRLKILWQEE